MPENNKPKPESGTEKIVMKRFAVIVDENMYNCFCKKYGKKFVDEVFKNEAQCNFDGHDWVEMLDSYLDVDTFREMSKIYGKRK